jgi:hypothetical protein
LAITYGGPEEGKGALIQWTSQKPSIGTGNMQISDSNLNRSVELAANFNNLEGTSSFEIAPSGSGSKITWSFGYDTGSSPLKRWKALMLDGFIGSEYRAGLEKLKETVEADRRPLTSPTSPTVSVTPAPPGVSSQPEQPSAALPGGVTPSGTPVPPGGTPPSGQPGQAAPGAPAVPATGSQTAGTPSSPQTGATTTVPETTTPAPAPPSKKKRRRNQ